MSRIKPIPYKAQKFVLGTSSKIEIDSDHSIKINKNLEAIQNRIRNYKHKNIQVNEANNQALVHHFRKLKSSQYRRLSNLNVIVNNLWGNRLKVFMILAQSLKRLSLVKHLSVTIDFCLDTRALNFLFTQMKHLKYIKTLRIDLSKFYRIPTSFIKSLGGLIRSFVKLKSTELALKKTPEMSFNDDLAYFFQVFKKLPDLTHLTFCYLESIQIKKYSQSDIPHKLIAEISKLSIPSLSFSVKSNSLFSELLKQLITSIAKNQELTRLNLDLQDVENVLDAEFTSSLLDKLNSCCALESISLNNQVQGASNEEIEQLYASTLKFITSHPKLISSKMRYVVPSYFKGMKLASSISSLKRLSHLNIIIPRSNELILLQELGKLTWLKELSIFLEFELDTQISGFLESIGSLSRLKVFKLESKKKIPGMFFQKEDFKTLLNSLQKLRDLRHLSVWVPILESSNPNAGKQEIDLVIDFLKNTHSLEECKLSFRMGEVLSPDLVPLFEAMLQNLKVLMNYEFWLGLRNSSKMNFSKILEELQKRYKKSLYERQKRGPLYSLIIKSD